MATGREEEERERKCVITPFVFSNKPVYSAHSNLCFDMIQSVQCSHLRSTTMSLIYRVPAAFVPRGNDQPASSSLTEMSGTKYFTRYTKEKKNQAENTTHSNASGLYTS